MRIYFERDSVIISKMTTKQRFFIVKGYLHCYKYNIVDKKYCAETIGQYFPGVLGLFLIKHYYIKHSPYSGFY